MCYLSFSIPQKVTLFTICVSIESLIHSNFCVDHVLFLLLLLNLMSVNIYLCFCKLLICLATEYFIWLLSSIYLHIFINGHIWKLWGLMITNFSAMNNLNIHFGDSVEEYWKQTQSGSPKSLEMLLPFFPGLLRKNLYTHTYSHVWCTKLFDLNINLYLFSISDLFFFLSTCPELVYWL